MTQNPFYNLTFASETRRIGRPQKTVFHARNNRKATKCIQVLRTLVETESARSLVASGAEIDCKNSGRPVADFMLTASPCRSLNRFRYSAMKSGICNMLLQPWFVITALLALTHQVLQKIFNLQIPLIDSFLDPLLFMPLLLHLILLERRFVFKKGAGYVLSSQHILGIVILISFICEVLFPRWSSSFTSDYKDVICYSFGGAVFGIFFNSPIPESGVK